MPYHGSGLPPFNTVAQQGQHPPPVVRCPVMPSSFLAVLRPRSSTRTPSKLFPRPAALVNVGLSPGPGTWSSRRLGTGRYRAVAKRLADGCRLASAEGCLNSPCSSPAQRRRRICHAAQGWLQILLGYSRGPIMHHPTASLDHDGKFGCSTSDIRCSDAHSASLCGPRTLSYSPPRRWGALPTWPSQASSAR